MTNDLHYDQKSQSMNHGCTVRINDYLSELWIYFISSEYT